MSSWILIFPALQELEELLSAALFEKTHQRASNRLHLCARNLGDLAIAIDKATGDLLELEVTSDISVNEDLGQFTRCDDELGDKVNSVVAVPSEFSGRCSVRPELAIQLDVDIHEGEVMRN